MTGGCHGEPFDWLRTSQGVAIQQIKQAGVAVIASAAWRSSGLKSHLAKGIVE